MKIKTDHEKQDTGLSALCLTLSVIPTGIEPVPSEPESDILSIELRDPFGSAKMVKKMHISNADA